MNATLLCVALLVPGYGEEDIVKRISAAGGAGHAGCIQWSTATDADLGELCELRSLERLDLDGSKVTDAGLRTLSNLRGLKLLSLAETAITDQGLRHLESMSQLRFLELDGCPQITDAGVARLQKALPMCKIDR